MSADFAPRHELEVVVARNRRAIANGTPEGWLTLAEVDDVMIAEAIRWAADHAERAFLATAWFPRLSKRAAVDCVEHVVIAYISDMLAEGHIAADLMGAMPEQRARIEAGRAHIFDRRLAYLRAFARMVFLRGSS